MTALRFRLKNVDTPIKNAKGSYCVFCRNGTRRVRLLVSRYNETNCLFSQPEELTWASAPCAQCLYWQYYDQWPRIYAQATYGRLQCRDRVSTEWHRQ